MADDPKQETGVTKRDYSNLTVGEVTSGIAETRAVLKRAEEAIKKAGELVVKPPIFGESTLRLRDHLEEDLNVLEKALEQAAKR
jgi:hypothetical protein